MAIEFEYLGHRIIIPDQEGRLAGTMPHPHSVPADFDVAPAPPSAPTARYDTEPDDHRSVKEHDDKRESGGHDEHPGAHVHQGHGHTHSEGQCCEQCCPYAGIPGHQHAPDAPMIPGEPERTFTLFIDDQEFMVHRLPSGTFHTHRLPFLPFTTMEDAARAIVNHLEYGVSHGREKKPEHPHGG